jgi:hypothetical protein
MMSVSLDPKRGLQSPHRETRQSAILCASEQRLVDTRPRHFAAGFGTAAARVGAAAHFFFVGHLIATLGARIAEIRAHAAGLVMLRRAAKHEIGAGCADLCTILQCADVIRTGMHAALVEAVLDRRQTDLMADRTLLNALPHLAADVSHGQTPFERTRESGLVVPAYTGAGWRPSSSIGDATVVPVMPVGYSQAVVIRRILGLSVAGG